MSSERVRIEFKKRSNEALYQVIQLVDYLSPVQFQDMELFLGVSVDRIIKIHSM